jgi:general secretion pathway protein K
MPAKTETNRKQRVPEAERGFVLLVVLSTVGLLALVAATFTLLARTHVKVAAVSSESARAEALADAGANLAILDLVASREKEANNRRFLLNATPVVCSYGSDGATLTIAVQDEAGKVDLNIGSEALLRALILGVGMESAEAAVDAILDFKDPDDDRLPSGAEASEYKAAGRLHGPKNAPFFVIEELGGVLGFRQADVDRLRPFVTIYSGQTGIDTNVAPQELIDILSRGAGEASGLAFKKSLTAGMQLKGAGGPLPEQFISASVRRAFSIHSEGRTPGGTVFAREAVVELGPSRSAPYVVRRWTRATSLLGAAEKDAQRGNAAACQ